MSLLLPGFSPTSILSSRLLSDGTILTTHESLFPGAPEPGCEATVIIPVKNEQENLPLALEALARQRDLNGAPLDCARYEILVLVNNTTDASAGAARSLARSYPRLRLNVAEITLPEQMAHVGQARKLLMDAACRRLRAIGKPRGVIASTDADTLVSPTWIAATLAEIEQGADAVGGRITLSEASLRTMDPNARVFHLRDVGYRHMVCLCESLIDPPTGDPWPRHFQHFGASIALTAEAYLGVGGLPVRASLEDVALYTALFRVDATVRHSPHVRVTTSARMSGRTGFGFAVQLQQWATMRRSGAPFLVESAGEVIDRLTCQRRLRTLWQRRHLPREGRIDSALERLAADLAVSPADLDREIFAGRPFGDTMLRIQQLQREAGEWARRYPAVDIVRATRDLREWMERHRPAAPPDSDTLEDIEQVQRFSATGDMTQVAI